MQRVTATVRDGRVELTEPVDWPDGTSVAVMRLNDPNETDCRPMADWPDGFFDQLRDEWGDEPFERPSQMQSPN
jgi:hypothetical protein